ncbi:MAG: helix-turn-helix domain-containing protein [Clostridia bacterium]|nr:helix-turn-helix domain-containing protein [Clostridia bacterium]
MIYENEARGEARIKNYLPTLPALRYLNCCTMAGWHRCNRLYHQSYSAGGRDVLVILTLEGSGFLKADGRSFILNKNSIVLVPPDTPMKYATEHSTGHWEFYWLDLAGAHVIDTANKLWQDEKAYFQGMASSASIFRRLLEESPTELECSELVGRLLDMLIAAGIFGGSGGSESKKSTADRILTYIAAHYREPISLCELSSQFYLSQNQIIRIIRTRTGYAPHEYLMRYRLTKACELLQGTSDPIGEIGRSVGYDNSSHFSARFRALYGISPGEYRAYFSR